MNYYHDALRWQQLCDYVCNMPRKKLIEELQALGSRIATKGKTEDELKDMLLDILYWEEDPYDYDDRN